MLSFSPSNSSYIYERGYCHNKVNSFGQMSKLNKSSVLEAKHAETVSLPRIKLGSSRNSNLNKSINKSKLLAKCMTDQTQLNPEFTVRQRDNVGKSQTLALKIKQLREMNLLDGKRLLNVRYEGQSKRSAIMNDYHSPKTNGGFSRSKIGGIYYK